MLSVRYAECRLQALCAKCHYAECCYAECCYAEYRYAECHGVLIRPQISIGKTSRLVDSHINRYGANR